MTSQRPFSLLFIAIILLPACKSVPANQPFLEQSRQAKSMMDNSQYEQAARVYQNLSQNAPQQPEYRLRAAEALLKAGESEHAQSLLSSIPRQQLDPLQTALFALLGAQIDLDQGNAESALTKLNQISAEQLDLSHQRDYFSALAFARALSGDVLGSVQSRIQLGQRLLDPEAIRKNNIAIIESLNRLPRQTLILQQPAAPDTLAGWMALADLLKQRTIDPDLFQLQLAQWQAQFPNHPANGDFLDQLLQHAPTQFNTQPTTIAVFLPLSGRFAKAAAIIKSGIQAAHSVDSNSAPTNIVFYDSNVDNPVALYHRAINAGAELIIGPLQKATITALSTADKLPVSVLALNQADHIFKENLIQFGLSPRDDSREIVTLAWLNDHRKALFLLPDTHKGHRLMGYLGEFWQQQGGRILESRFYAPSSFDFSAAIKTLMNLDESERRYHRLVRRLNRNIQFEPRARTDADNIFLMATPDTARSLNPQLKFYGARHVPVYATSDIYSGIPMPRQDNDLNGIRFCDIPWFFPDIYADEPSFNSLLVDLQNTPYTYRRLLALGIDAYNMIPFLNEMRDREYAGASGRLLLTQDNHIIRHLVCADFENGIPANPQYLTDIETDDFYDD
ncbi:penicillin-binding protein activator [methane-oxidizing endosymbiont of Gigantopelta aegis]|uniref:penicillin-binding protein activator n=1 Tax=methane-oxidizing endosymbiont of Gigantopelta aegis TaxID=2794938 RepID=UPI0018DBEF18|nr:penicillin-binding protein activator [methane-oxidizing endosymbiont of Gigantopelta aegis]